MRNLIIIMVISFMAICISCEKTNAPTITIKKTPSQPTKAPPTDSVKLKSVIIEPAIALSESVEVYLNLDHIVDNGNHIIRGKTNLPKGTKILLSIERDCKILNTRISYYSDEIILLVDSFNFVIEGKYLYLNRKESSDTIPFGYYSVGFMMRSCYMGENKSQSIPVSKILGSKGENLFGKDIINEMEGKHLEKEIKFRIGTDGQINKEETEMQKYLLSLWQEMKDIIKGGKSMGSVRASNKLGSPDCHDKFKNYRMKIKTLEKKIFDLSNCPISREWRYVVNVLYGCVWCASHEEALETCKELNDILNRDKPVWKKERWE